MSDILVFVGQVLLLVVMVGIAAAFIAVISALIYAMWSMTSELRSLRK